jgi:glutathionyl-hydroquinone reductase
MGLLVEGKWVDRWYDTGKSGGRFVRKPTSFHGSVSADGSTHFPAESGRYHLYVGLACPWAHRTLIVRALKGLEKAIPVHVVDALMLEDGWTLSEEGQPPFLRDVYVKADPAYTGRVTVPVLWDTVTETIVNNESSEIIRMLNHAFDAFAEAPELDFYPQGLRAEIDAVNERVYPGLNNGAYRAGFAVTQEAYDKAVADVFDTLDWLERRLAKSRYLVGDEVTEADWRLFTTLVRFDAVYYSHFKCNVRRLVDYPNLHGYLLDLFQKPGVSETVSLEQIKLHYFGSHRSINPTGIVPTGPDQDLFAPHGRDTTEA